MGTLKQKNKDYLSGPEMLKEIIRCQQNNVISDKLARMFMLLSNRYSSKANFSGYTYRDEMVASGILACVVAFPKFDPTKSNNPFAYFTKCIHRAFLQILNKEKTQQVLRDTILVKEGHNPSFNFMESTEFEE